MTIQQIDSKTFAVDNGHGTSLTLIQTQWGWEVQAQNAATRAYNRGFASCKTFNTLSEVESNYKSFRGLAALIA